jgi:hypothetical protein
VFLCLSAILCGQVTTGTILGTVVDATGSVVPGAVVVITESSKGTSQQFVTDGAGFFNAPYLAPGTYQVAVQKDGFKRELRSGITLEVDQRARIDVTLAPGAVTETIEVTAAAPLVRSESAELGEVITEQAVSELPLNGRNFAQLVYLVPGVTPGQQGENLSGASTFNPRAASNYNALGSQANANAWLVDGIDNNEYTFNTVIVQPSVESVREFKALTGVYSAEFGRGAGVVSVSTKSGGNDLHMTLFEFLRNHKLDARNYFQRKIVNDREVPKPVYRRNQYGAAFSGPVVLPKVYNGRNRTFFFADYYGARETRGLTFVNTVPTAATRRGDFSDYRNASGALIPIYDPYTTRENPAFDPSRPVSASNPQFLRTQFTGNVIPQERISAVGGNIAGIYPLPNRPGNFNNFEIDVPRTIDDDGFNTRIDHQIGPGDSLFVRYSYQYFRLDAPQGQANCCLPTPADAASRFDLGPYVAGIQNTRLRTSGLAVNETHVFRPNLVNEFRGGYARTIPRTVQSDFGHAAAESLGIRGINLTDNTSGIPNINVQEFTGLSGGPGFLPANPRETHWQLEDGMSWTVDRHTLKFGYRYIRRMVSPFTGPPGGAATRGNLTFNSNFTNDPVTNSGGAGLATLLIGHLTAGQRGFLRDVYYTTNTDHGAYFQDDWRVSRRLTVNLGLRYDVWTPDVEIRDRLANFDQENLRLVYAGIDGVSRTAGKKTDFNNFGPRAGFAWDITGDGKTVMRGGFGLSYFPVQPSASNLIGQQVPFVISQDLGNIPVNPTNWAAIPTIDNPFPPVQPIQPRTTADLNAARPTPIVIGHSWTNETPYMETWTLNIERQLAEMLMAEIGYAGSRGLHLPLGLNINEVQPGTGSQPSRRLIQPLSNISQVIMFDPRNMSNYHGLQAKLVKRYSNGLHLLLAYTFSKALDYGGSAASGGGAAGGPQTVTNLKAGYGPAGFDVKHRFVGSYVYDLPFGAGRRWLREGVLEKALGGWGVYGITTIQTGRPFSVSLSQGVNNGAPSWPNRIGPGKLDDPDPFLWFNPADFVAPPPNTYGNVQRGVLYGPGQTNFDLSFVKNTSLGENWRFQLRLDGFNIFNTPYFGFPNASIGSATAGRITSTNGDNRTLQLGAKIEF